MQMSFMYCEFKIEFTKNGDQLLTRKKGPPDNEHPAMGFYS